MAHRPPKLPGSQQTLHGFFANRTCASSAAQSSNPSLEENSDHSEDPEIEVCSDSDLPQMESEVDSDDDGGTVTDSVVVMRVRSVYLLKLSQMTTL